MIRQTLYPNKNTVNTVYWEYKNLMTAANVLNFPMKTTKFLVASHEIVSKMTNISTEYEFAHTVYDY